MFSRKIFFFFLSFFFFSQLQKVTRKKRQLDKKSVSLYMEGVNFFSSERRNKRRRFAFVRLEER